jgi:dihydroorotase
MKTAHFQGPGWAPVDRTIEAARRSGTPAMFHFGPRHGQTCQELFARLRPGDIPTHMYSRLYPILTEDGLVSKAFHQARRKQLLFDVGHGSGSFRFALAAPAIQQGFGPDVISTDLHWRSRLLRDATLMATMSKFLNMGLSLVEVISRTTVAPAQAIARPELGTLTPGACADMAILRVQEGDFGFVDSGDTRLQGDRKLECLLTIRAGEIVWDLNGISRPDWQNEE